MSAKAVLRTKRASGILAGAVALILISAACGLVWAITGGEASQDRHPSGEATIVERSGQRPTEDVAVKEPRVRSRGFSAAPLSPLAVYTLALEGKKIEDPFLDFGNRGKKFNPQGEIVGPLAVDPVQKILVICVKFTTPPPGGPEERLDLSYFDNLLFGTVYDPPEYAAYPGHPTDRTLRNYYNEVSYGQMDVITLDLPSKTGWVQSGKSYDYYCRADGIHDQGKGPYPENVQGLVIDAIKAVDSKVDFSKYAVDGEVPNLIVVHAGAGAEFMRNPSLIRSHMNFLSNGTGLEGYWADGVKIDTYVILPEVSGDPTRSILGRPLGPFPPTVGMYAHEWGHVLGLPDQYDYGSESDGTGYYSLMARGCWCFSYPDAKFPDFFMFLGNSPAHLDAWSKYRLGFVTPITVQPNSLELAVLPPVESSPVVYRMDVPNSGGKEYFLLENRQHIGFDQSLDSMAGPLDPTRIFAGGRGLAIWHIDDTVLTRNYWRPNEAENWKKFRSEGNRKAWTGETHYGISVIQADDQWHLEQMVNWGGDLADFFPGALGVTRFGDDTYPNSSSYYFWPGSEPRFGYSGVTVDNIEETDGGVIMADLFFVP
jgi:M6 family metalloprotease-like protein